MLSEVGLLMREINLMFIISLPVCSHIEISINSTIEFSLSI